MPFFFASREARSRKPKIFYGYFVVAVSVVIQLIVWGLYNSYGIFFAQFLNEFGWSRATISGAASLCQLMIGIGAVFLGSLNDRFGPRVLMTICGVLTGAGFLLLSMVGSVWQLYVFYGLIVGIGMSGTDVVLLSTTARWFIKRRGVMSGIVKIGTGLGTLIMPFVITWIMLGYGWRNSYLIIGIFVIIIVVACAQLLRRDPVLMQLRPDGVVVVESTTTVAIEEQGMSLGQAAHTRQFWMLCFAYLVVFFCGNTIIVHIAAHAVDLGFSISIGASVVAVIGGSSIAGRFVIGLAADKIGCRRALIICFGILIVALLLFQIALASLVLFIFGLFYGFCHGGFYALISPVVAEFFGTRYHGGILGVFIFWGSVGGAIGPLLVGYIFDITSSYHLSFLLLLALAVMGLVVILLSNRKVMDDQALPGVR